MAGIQINSLDKRFNDLPVLANFSIEFLPNQIHCLFGPSGCGKTTLLQLICGLLLPDGGRIEGVTGRTFSSVFQETRLLPWSTVKENITFVLKDKSVADKYVSLVELTPFQHYYPDQLSGGMKQRVAIARAFAYQGDILLLDEPFKGLDFSLKESFMDYLLTYWREKKPICLFVTHDVDEALYLADVIHIFSGPPLTLKKQLKIPIPQARRPGQIQQMNNYKTILKNTEKISSRC